MQILSLSRKTVRRLIPKTSETRSAVRPDSVTRITERALRYSAIDVLWSRNCFAHSISSLRILTCLDMVHLHIITYDSILLNVNWNHNGSF